MASAWGDAWGDSWGDAWGVIAPPEPAGPRLIQCLEPLIDPTTEALPVDFGTGIPLVTDPSTNNNARGLGDRNPLYPNGQRRKVRRGGSGVQPNRKQHNPFVARDDSDSAEVGGSQINTNVLANDTYTGTPAIVIISGPTLSGASASVSGGGNESQIDYTPPATGSGGQDRIRYRLTATGARGSKIATLRINVTATGPAGVYDEPSPMPSGAFWVLGGEDVPGINFGGTVSGTGSLTFSAAFLYPTTPASPPTPVPGQVYLVIGVDELDALVSQLEDDFGPAPASMEGASFTIEVTSDTETNGTYPATIVIT